MIIIHHNKDLDGFSSGAICKLKFPDAKLIGWDYKDPIPDFKDFIGQEVILIDISFPIEKLKILSDVTASLTVIDHHISFYKEVEEAYPNGVRPFIYVYEANKAACEIGWEYLFPDKPIPYEITLLGRYDTWRKSEGDWEKETLPFQYGMRIKCVSAETFDADIFDPMTKCTPFYVQMGKTVLDYQEQQDMLACERSSFEAVIAGKSAICLNARAFSSNTMASVYDPTKHDVMVGFEYTGTKWSISLRADKPGVDVGVIAKSRGGGGHKAAAGFECNTFEEIFK